VTYPGEKYKDFSKMFQGVEKYEDFSKWSYCIGRSA
jgi:hypothetical protein